MITKYLIGALICILAIANTHTIAAETIRLSEVKQLSFRTNKTEYLPGDSILVHYWVIDPTTQQPTAIEGGVTFQLLDKAGLEISSVRSLPTVKGTTTFVQAPYSKGVHYLRAYTDEMLNISDNLIPSTPLYINALKDDFAPYPNKQINLYPEGGVLVPGHSQRIVISAPSYIGDSVFVYNKAHKRQAETIISEYGNSLIMLTPEINETYTIRIQEVEVPLEVKPYATTLQLTQNRDRIIYSALSDRAITKASKTKLEIFTGNELLHTSYLDDSNAKGSFDISKLPNSTLLFILTQNDSIQIAQRAVFIDKVDEIEKPLLSKSIVNTTQTANLKVDFSDIDPEQSYRVYINTFTPLLTDLLPLSAKQSAQLSDCFDAQLPAAKRHYIIDLLMIQESERLAFDFKNIYTNGYSNKLRGKVKKEVTGTVDEGKIIAINADNRNLSESSLGKGGVFDIDLGSFIDSTSFYLQAYNKKDKSKFFVIEIDSVYKPNFTPTHGKIKQKFEAYTSRENIKDIAFEDVIPEVKVTAKKMEKHIESNLFYEGKTFTAQKIRERVYTSLEQIINNMTDVFVATILDEKERPTKVICNKKGRSIIGDKYIPIVNIMLDNLYLDFEEANNLLDVNDIEKVEYISVARAGVYGTKAFNGLVKIETKSGWTTQEVPSQGLKFYPKGFSKRTERASWHKPDNECIVVTGQELIDGTTIATANTINLMLIEGFDKTGKMIQQRITMSD